MPLILAGATSGSTTINPTDAVTVVLTAPATSGTLAVSGGAPSFATLTVTGDASISGLTVGKGGGAVSSNTAFGLGVMGATATGLYNTGVGRLALPALTSGASNTAIGNGALYSNTTGNSNTGLGLNALSQNIAGANNTAVGEGALSANTASNNTAVGYQAGYSNTTGGYVAAFGYQALYSNTTNFSNTALGYRAGYACTGPANTFIGKEAGSAVTTGSSNTFVGYSDSTGYGSGGLITTGAKNSILGGYNGNQGGLDIRTASNYIVLSDGDGNPRGACNASGQWRFGQNNPLSGFGATAVEANAGSTGWAGLIVISADSTGQYTQITWNQGTTGNNLFTGFYTEATVGTATLRGAISFNRTSGLTVYATTSDYRAKTVTGVIENALARTMQLKPCTGRMNGATEDIDFFVAHELQEFVPSAVAGIKDAVKEDGTPVYQMVDKSAIIPLLVAAIQELNAKVTALEAQLGAK